MGLKEYTNVLIKSLLLAIIFLIVLTGLYYLISFDYNFAYYVSEITGIPSDLSISIVSAGFANNILIIMVTVEFGLTCYLIERISKTNTYNKIKTFVSNL